MHRFLVRSIEAKRFIIIGALLLWCVSLIAFRVERTGSFFFVFLIWNLVLAGVPLVASTTLRATERFRLPLAVQASCFGLWLLFLPNAPYILTDLLHLAPRPPAPPWYDLALLLSCSGTGLLLGYLSLVDVHGIVAKRFGAVTGWIVAVCTLFLTGFAIYLGRFLRWNSWEVLTNPVRLFDIVDGLRHPASHPRTVAVTSIFGIILALGYIALRVLLVYPALRGDKARSKRNRVTIRSAG